MLNNWGGKDGVISVVECSLKCHCPNMLFNLKHKDDHNISKKITMIANVSVIENIMYVEGGCMKWRGKTDSGYSI